MAHARAIDTANEVITSIRTVKSMAGEEKENFRFKKFLNQVNRIITGKALTSGISMSVVHFSLWMSCAVAFCKNKLFISKLIFCSLWRISCRLETTDYWRYGQCVW